MRQSTVRSAALFLALAATAPVWAEKGGPMDQAASQADHAMGKEKWDLKVLERDSKVGKPTLERGMADVNKVERKSSYPPNGRLATQETRQYVGSTDTPTYVERSEWSPSGKVVHEFRENDKMENGVQTAGDGWEKDYNKGKVLKEVKRRWTVDSKNWNDFYIQTTSYHSNGDMKERVTAETDKNSKIQETWGTKKANGERNKSTHSWNGEAKRWD
jgi:hypothetical protein